MDTQQHPPMNGNDDLAKTLDAGLQFEETPMAGASPAPAGSQAPITDNSAPGAPTEGTLAPPSLDPLPTPDDTPPLASAADEPPAIKHGHGKSSSSPLAASGGAGGDLDKIKASALEELRPLVGKLDLPAEEKFDTLLLIIRTTDDQGLLEEAHKAAKDIGDDKRRAQALLDIVKEIDYFSTKR